MKASGAAAVEDGVAKPFGLGMHEAADAIVKVANANMSDAVRLISISRGYDPRDFALVAFGGAGALHGVDVARELFARKGIEATTMNDIAVASERGRRTLYTYFRNKEEIYYAVIQSELERLSEEMDRVAGLDIGPEQKILLLIYTHLRMIKETVGRNGSLRAEFFRNIWMVEKVRKPFDAEERDIIRRVLQEGVNSGQFHIDNVGLMTDIILYTTKGLEVPYIYDRLGMGLTEEETKPMVMGIIRRALGDL